MKDPATTTGLLVVISGPGGVGKGTVCQELLKDGDLAVSVSVTTRAPRPDEKEGRHYYFRTRAEFERLRAEGRLLESAEVSGNLYGTPRAEVEKLLAAGKTVILEIDVQGGRQVKSVLPCLTIFLMPPSREELEARFCRRGADSAQVMAARMALAVEEIAAAADYDFVVVNDELARTVTEVRQIIKTAREKGDGI
ncbi:MAG: guanylate kinase [Gracilibacteraceae bacterium]|jgi:guanylate kinase|nr:guanylate kinase [Gracilibacteraceae bacterium]